MQTKSAKPVVYDTKPATEWILGGPVQKVSPRYEHGFCQLFVGDRLRR